MRLVHISPITCYKWSRAREELCPFWVTAQFQRAQVSWLVMRWENNSPFLAFKEWANNLWLRGDTHSPGVAWGIWGRGGYGRLLNRGTEIQEFQDDVPKAVNQMPETNGQNNLEEGLARSTDTRSLFMTFILPSPPCPLLISLVNSKFQ